MKCNKSVESTTITEATPAVETSTTAYNTFENEHIELSPIQEIASTETDNNTNTNTSSSPEVVKSIQLQQSQHDKDNVGGLSPILKSENEFNEIDAENEFLLDENELTTPSSTIPIIQSEPIISSSNILPPPPPPAPPVDENDNNISLPSPQRSNNIPIQFNSPNNKDCNKPLKIIHKSSPSPLREFKPKFLSTDLQNLYTELYNNNNNDPLQRYEVPTLDTSSISSNIKPTNNDSTIITLDESNNINTSEVSTNDDSLTKSFIKYSKDELQQQDDDDEDSSFETNTQPSHQLLFNESPSNISSSNIDYNNITVNDVDKISNIGESIHQSEEYMKYIHTLTKDLDNKSTTTTTTTTPIKNNNNDKRHLLKKRSYTPQPTVFHSTPKKEIKSAERSRSLRKTESPIKSPNRTKKFSPTKVLFQSPRLHPSFVSPDKTKTQQQKRRECQDLIKEINNQLEVWEQKIPRDLLAKKWIKSVMKKMEEFKEDITIPRGYTTQLRDLTERLTIKKSITNNITTPNKKSNKITEVL